jgi:type IX secretion system PorP/SprF family membrane protein
MLVKYKHISGFLLLLLLIAGTNLSLNAQNSMRFSQYMHNELSFNPAYCGTSNYTKATLAYRSQWLRIDGAPETQSFTFDAPIYGNNIGLGGVFFRESIGIQQDYGFMLNYAYRVNFSDSKLSFGMQGGFINKTVGWTDLRLVHRDDPIFPDLDMNMWVPNFGFGVFFYSKLFYLGFSAPRILANEIPIDQTSAEYFSLSKSHIHYYLASGYLIMLNNQTVLKPSLLWKMVSNGANQLDLSVNLYLRNRINFGIGFHAGDSYVFMVGYQINDKLLFNYSYDATYNELMYNKPITNEITLSYKFSSGNEKVISPRYF